MSGSFTIPVKYGAALKDSQFVEDVDYFLTQWDNKSFTFEIYRLDRVTEFADFLRTIPGSTIEASTPIQHYSHLPEPSHLYKYENPLLECSECHQQVHFEAIEEDYDGDENYYTECPNCKAKNSFPDTEMESIDNMEK